MPLSIQLRNLITAVHVSLERRSLSYICNDGHAILRLINLVFIKAVKSID